MKLLLKIMQYILGGVGLIITYGTPIADLLKVKPWGLSWAWYALIGATVLFVVLGTIIYELHSENKSLKSQDKELERDIKRLEKEKLEWEKTSRGPIF